jgi:dsRNA-specific ribonuclease
MGKRVRDNEKGHDTEQKHNKRVKSDKKEKKEHRKKDKSKHDKVSTNVFKQVAIHELMSIEHSINIIQENIKKIIELSPNASELSAYINHLLSLSVNSDPQSNGDVTAKILLLSKSHKVQLAAQLKSLYEDNKLEIFDQIINFNDKTILKSADDVRLLLTEKKKDIYERNSEVTSNANSILPNLPVIYDSVLEAKVFVHKSATNGDLHSSKYDQVQSNNERLEYLGDAVLETVVSDIIEYNYPDFDEGQLSKLRSILVKNETIEIISRSYKFPERQQELLNSHVIKTDLAINTKFRSNKRIADLFEAYIGALFIEKGRDGSAYDFIKEWLIQVYTPILKEFDGSDHLKYSHISKNLADRLLNNSKLPTLKSFISSPSASESTSSPISISPPEVKTIKPTDGLYDKDETMKFQKFPITLTSAEPINKLAKGELYALIGCAKLHPNYKTLQFQKNSGSPCIVECSISEDILGIGEGQNAKEASARAAQAALLNKKKIEKYHLIRMMTPRDETMVSKKFDTLTEDENKSKPKKKVFEPKILAKPYFISTSQISSPNGSSRTKLIEILGKHSIIPQIVSEQDTTTNSVLPLFKTSLKLKDKVIATCVEASKKKGANKVSQYLLEKIDEHGEDTILNDIRAL